MPVQGIRIEQEELSLAEQKIAQVQIAMPEAGLTELADDRDHLIAQLAVIGRALAAKGKFVQVLIQRLGRLDSFQDDGVAFDLADRKPAQLRNRSRRWDLRPLHRLEIQEFPKRRAAAKQALEPSLSAGIKLEVVRFAGKLESPDLPVWTHFQQGPDFREIGESAL
jgi:hypothetical protein